MPIDIDPAAYIDHTLLDPTANRERISELCHQADRFNFASVCVYPCYVRLAAELLHNKRPQVSTVIGFPSGATTSATKLYEAHEANENGATELDVVINLGWLKDGETDAVHREIAEICEGVDLPVKAILEMGLLTPAEQKLAAEICLDAGAAFLKTSTGWAGGATVEQIKLLKSITKGRIGIKASGGIRSFAQVVALIEAGATRIGTSRGLQIMAEFTAPDLRISDSASDIGVD
ncbi:Deoxyribose-phosphate aldolase [Thalassoporum mexicanum PCC 7367]|uniref:deoxyribose-phosphate aldolase n=1 Tax=Thalassoporum mexicanum TaxID=3457544 RepID=UPI00029FC8CD|nr:deoxyribose-phosphate aldolase [Pseudanabaena sp. PCC 7367]AFY71037.1 Deoxyribose-phosphate aldolase [Pseudanabaena sp. PCC 7367]